MNIDPMELYPDVDIWKVVQASHLKGFVMSQPENLVYDCGDSGSNLRYTLTLEIFFISSPVIRKIAYMRPDTKVALSTNSI